MSSIRQFNLLINGLQLAVVYRRMQLERRVVQPGCWLNRFIDWLLNVRNARLQLPSIARMFASAVSY
jgi:hypothetical protein